jgi:hypothetical protein
VPNSQAVELTPDAITQIRGETQMVDVTIVHVGAITNVYSEYQALKIGGGTDPDPAMRRAATRKVSKYKPLIRVTGEASSLSSFSASELYATKHMNFVARPPSAPLRHFALRSSSS